ncbi:hypothetical protein E4U19_002019 [Claviceps sp. Clav32 group G5]|nr:hypothetical protein E4U19_002019 [Claviceps sp. Clav32 group G5]KAG6048770.1 hypothetical protein E4U39_007032 [Claviceps sp. Clav50 group G5]
MRVSALAVAAFAGIALAAKRGCRHDHEHPGMGWYWTVEYDDLYSIAKDFGDDAVAIASRNGLKNKYLLPAFIKFKHLRQMPSLAQGPRGYLKSKL